MVKSLHCCSNSKPNIRADIKHRKAHKRLSVHLCKAVSDGHNQSDKTDNMSGFTTSLLDGKVGLVTGAGSPYGIGRSIVLGLAAAGARAVYATDLNLTNIPSLQEEVKKSGSTCEIHGVVLDVTDEQQTIDVLKQVIEAYGRLDFYFANAGVGRYV
jgi:shikimate 5-dehydrogenase